MNTMRDDMKRRMLGFLLPALVPALLAFNPGHAQSLADAETAAGTLPLWELTHGETTLYLLGSIHLLRPEAYPLDPAIYEAFDTAERVVFELDFDEMVAGAPVMMARGMLDDGRTIRDVLPADVVVDLEQRLSALPLPMEMAENMKPWLLAMTLSSMVLQQAGYTAEAGIDMHFFRRAQESGKPVIGLETMEEQIDVFDALDEAAQAAFLKQTLADLDDTVSQLDEATALWQRGDAMGLAAMFTESLGDQPLLMERLLYERNRQWIAPIEELLHGGEPAIVIVGMGHLIGEGSVIELLRARGHTLERVRCTAGAGACATP